MLDISSISLRTVLRSLSCACLIVFLGTQVKAVDSLELITSDLSACAELSGDAVFNLQAHEVVLADGQEGVTMTWYEDAAFTIQITNTAAYTSPSRTVWIIGSTTDPDCQDTVNIDLFALAPPDLSYLDVIGDTVCGPLSGFGFNAADGPEATYNWTPGQLLEDSTVANPVFLPEASGETYTLSVVSTNEDGCEASATFSFLYLEADLRINEGDIVFSCKTDPDQMEVSLSATTSGNPDDIQWTASRDTLSDLSGPTTSIFPEFTTTIVASQSFPNGCFLTDTVLVQVDSLPTFDIEVVEDLEQPCMKYCPGKLVTLSTAAPDFECYPDVEYEWLPPQSGSGDMIQSDTTLNVSLLVTNGNTQNYIRITRNNACIERDSFLIEVVDTIPAFLTAPTQGCPGDQFVLEIDPAYLASGSFTDITWSITPGGTLDCGDCEGQTSVGVTLEEGARGSVNIIVRGIREECCTASNTHTITIPVRPLSISPTIFCIEEDKVVTASPSDHTNYMWTATGADITGNGNMATINSIFNSDTSFQIQVNAIAPDGCPSQGVGTVNVVNPSIRLDFDPSLASAAIGSDVTASATLTPPTSEPFVWTVNGEEVATAAEYVFTLEFGEFELCATAMTSTGCVATECVIIERLFDIIIPNVFQPSDNMNPLNQTFRPFSPDMDGNVPLNTEDIVDFQVFNRWGQKVYDNDSNDSGWDGTQDGEPAPSDVYIYKMELTNADGEARTFTGDVTLLR